MQDLLYIYRLYSVIKPISDTQSGAFWGSWRAESGH